MAGARSGYRTDTCGTRKPTNPSHDGRREPRQTRRFAVTGILMGGLFLVAGLSIIFVALDWIHVDPASIHAPRWVLGLCEN